MSALLLLMPGTPMIFQGQEFAASSPFLYFADISESIARKVHEGRKKFMAQFASIAQPEVQAMLPDPADPATFVRSKLNLSERYSHAEIYRLHRDLLRLRREDPVLGRQERRGVDGAVLGPDTLLLRFFGDAGDARLLLVNFGVDLNLSPSPEPLLAPPFQRKWSVLWSSEDPCYGGVGTAPLETDENWRIPGYAAVLMLPEEA
jgi:maltooligosyltrehalose trehalohydrolase